MTDGAMTRFLMSTREAIGLIFQALEHAIGGEVFVMRMPATTVDIITDVMIDLFGNGNTKKKIIGSRPGEKQSEVLVSKNEVPTTKVFDNRYYVILPQFKNAELDAQYGKLENLGSVEFNSNNAVQLNPDELKTILKNEKWLWD